jgi:CO dehydrogenase/acetyl-CoA synthase delta subunit
MPDHQRLIVTLQSATTSLAAVRKSIAVGGHIQAITEFDTLVELALEEAKRCLIAAMQEDAEYRRAARAVSQIIRQR